MEVEITYELIHCRMDGEILFAQDLGRNLRERMTIDLDMGLRIQGTAGRQVINEIANIRQLMRINIDAPQS